MAQQQLPYGAVDNDPNPANRISNREAWKRTGEMFSEFYSKDSRIISAADIRFASQPTTEAKIDAAAAQAIIELATVVFIPAFMLPFDVTLITNLAAFHAAKGRFVREGGEFSMYDVLAYGATANGIADDTPSFIAALQGVDAHGVGGGVNASGGGTLYVPPGDYLMGSNPFLTVTSLHPCRIIGAGMQSTIIRKGFNGNWFTFGVNFGNYIRWENLTFHGQYDTGVTGAGFVYTGNSGGAGNDYHSFFRVRFLGIAGPIFSIGLDAAQSLSLLDCEGYPDSTQGEYQVLVTSATDTGARFRRVSHSVFNLGYFDVSGADDTFFSNSAFKRIETSSTTSELFVNACVWGNLSAAMTIKGQGAIIGCRFSGDVTLDVSFTGFFMGNFQTAGTFTDSTTSAGAATVVHRTLAQSWAVLDHLRFSGTKNPEEIQTWRVSADQGDTSPAQLVLDQGVTIAWFNTPLTSNRTVTLPAVTGNRDGKTIRVVRSKAATGASTLTVDTTPNTILAAGQWVDCSRNGPLSQWTPTAGGTLP